MSGEFRSTVDHREIERWSESADGAENKAREAGDRYMNHEQPERSRFAPWAIAVMCLVIVEVALGYGFYTRSIDLAPIGQAVLLVLLPAVLYLLMGIVIRRRSD